jgi:hypothetical protein
MFSIGWKDTIRKFVESRALEKNMQMMSQLGANFRKSNKFYSDFVKEDSVFWVYLELCLVKFWDNPKYRNAIIKFFSSIKNTLEKDSTGTTFRNLDDYKVFKGKIYNLYNNVYMPRKDYIIAYCNITEESDPETKSETQIKKFDKTFVGLLHFFMYLFDYTKRK